MTPCAIVLQGFQGTPRLIDSWVSLKSLFLFMALALLVSFILRNAKDGVATFFKSAISLNHTESSASFDVRNSRFKSLALAISIIVLSLFMSLGIQQIIDGGFSSFRKPEEWTPIVLRSVSLKAILISAAFILIYISAKSLAIFLFSSIHFKREYRWNNIDFFLSYLMAGTLILIPLLLYNEVLPLNGKVFLGIATAIWIVVKAWCALHIYVDFFSKGITFLRFFLYFCGLEILPLPVFCKCLFLIS